MAQPLSYSHITNNLLHAAVQPGLGGLPVSLAVPLVGETVPILTSLYSPCNCGSGFTCSLSSSPRKKKVSSARPTAIVEFTGSHQSTAFPSLPHLVTLASLHDTCAACITILQASESISRLTKTMSMHGHCWNGTRLMSNKTKQSRCAYLEGTNSHLAA